MKKILVATLIVATFAGVASSEGIKNRMEFPAKTGVVVFYHDQHVGEVQGKCTPCHEKIPGKIQGFGKEYAHKNCIPCHDGHDDMPEGPTKCEGCHKQ